MMTLASEALRLGWGSVKDVMILYLWEGGFPEGLSLCSPAGCGHGVQRWYL